MLEKIDLDSILSKDKGTLKIAFKINEIVDNINVVNHLLHISNTMPNPFACSCHFKPGEGIEVDNLNNLICKRCGLPIKMPGRP